MRAWALSASPALASLARVALSERISQVDLLATTPQPPSPLDLDEGIGNHLDQDSLQQDDPEIKESWTHLKEEDGRLGKYYVTDQFRRMSLSTLPTSVSSFDLSSAGKGEEERWRRFSFRSSRRAKPTSSLAGDSIAEEGEGGGGTLGVGRSAGRPVQPRDVLETLRRNSVRGQLDFDRQASLVPDDPAQLDPKTRDGRNCDLWSRRARGVSTSVGRWGCMSAMIREAFLAVLGDLPQDPQLFKVRRREHMSRALSTQSLSGSQTSLFRFSLAESRSKVDSKNGRSLAASLLEGEANATVGEWDAVDFAPGVCRAARKRMYSWQKCETSIYAYEEFKSLAEDTRFQPNNKDPVLPLLEDSISSGPIHAFSPDAGRSGSTFAQTADGRFKIKMGLKSSLRQDEPWNLMKLMHGRDGTSDSRVQKRLDLRTYLENNPSSLLNRILGVMRLQFIDKDSRWAIIMSDAAYGMNEMFSGHPGIHVTIYDLKGSSRKDGKRSKENAKTLQNVEFTEKEGGLLNLTTRECADFLKVVKADTAFLQMHKLIDYSFLVVVVTSLGEDTLDCRDTPGSPYCFVATGGKKMYTISIIDYLNNLNWAKKLEGAANKGKFDGYDEKMVAFASSICKTEPVTLSDNPSHQVLDNGIVHDEVGVPHMNDLHGQPIAVAVGDGR